MKVEETIQTRCWYKSGESMLDEGLGLVKACTLNHRVGVFILIQDGLGVA